MYKINCRNAKNNIIRNHLNLGGTNICNDTIAVNNLFIEKNGQPFVIVMGEIHYTRLPKEEWRERLNYMKACGINTVATYVIWIHHQEKEFEAYNWHGNRNLREFVLLIKELGMDCFLRIGPWTHGEVRNGGFPDYIAENFGTRPTEIPTEKTSDYMQIVKKHYKEIAEQIEGLCFKDGGNIIAIQVDNEYYGGADYLMRLKEIAIDLGMIVPIYIVTGWGGCEFVEEEFVPVYGGYAEAGWMPYDYDSTSNDSFHFRKRRNDKKIGADIFGEVESKTENYVQKYPYLTAEIGGGMPLYIHRRPVMTAKDIASVAYCKLGSGSNLNGYYMFCGGTNPMGMYSTMQETTETGSLNNMPIFAYDFFGPLNDHGYINECYNHLRRLHFFINDFGDKLAYMNMYLPDREEVAIDDYKNLRFAYRTDGNSGFVFVNNHNKYMRMPNFSKVSFDITTNNNSIITPKLDIKNSDFFIIPFNLDLAGVNLISTNTQILSKIDKTFVFSAIGENAPVFIFDANVEIKGNGFVVEKEIDTQKIIFTNKFDIISFDVSLGELKSKIIILSERISYKLWKDLYKGKERFFISDCSLIFEDEGLVLCGTSEKMNVNIFPCEDLQTNIGYTDVFANHSYSVPKQDAQIIVDRVNDNVYNLKVSKFKFESIHNAFLKITYKGDKINFYEKNSLIDDQVWNGIPIYKSVKRFKNCIFDEGLRIEVTDLLKEERIFFDSSVQRNGDIKGEIIDVELIYYYNKRI